MTRGFLRLALALGVFWCAHASAVCTVATAPMVNPISFGTVPSQNVPAGGLTPNSSAMATYFSVGCTTTLSLGILSTSSWLRYAVQQAPQLSNGVDTIGYSIASNSAFNPAITASGQSIGGPTGFSLLSLIVLASTSEMRVPIFLRTNATTTWPSAGTYTGTQSLAVTGVICTGLGIGGLCLGTTNINGLVTMNINLTVSKSCEFSSTAALVDFGSISFLSNAGAAQLAATVRCTHQEDYALYADNGNNFSGGSRYLNDGNGRRIAYGIYHQGNATQPLNATTPMSRLGTGAAENLTLPVLITPGQSTPAAGIYRDNVRLVLEY
ncbi:MAG: spore coat U domain-containing protein [Cellvibrionaceae bacterium]|nr:spore coat U domain-containing protein [Cellvibrionaceae bacterium]